MEVILSSQIYVKLKKEKMNKLYTFTLILLTGSLFISCEAETAETTLSSNRVAPISGGKQLTVINNSDFTMTGTIYCYGAQDNVFVNSDIVVMGNATIPANNEITYKNFAEITNETYRVNPWRVMLNEGTPVSYNGNHTNQMYGQLFNQATGASQNKFANWRYLKMELTTTTIPGFVNPIPLVFELPNFSNNNSGETIINLAPYGYHQNLHITQSSLINASGNIILKIESEVVNQTSASE